MLAAAVGGLVPAVLRGPEAAAEIDCNIVIASDCRTEVKAVDINWRHFKIDEAHVLTIGRR